MEFWNSMYLSMPVFFWKKWEEVIKGAHFLSPTSLKGAYMRILVLISCSSFRNIRWSYKKKSSLFWYEKYLQGRFFLRTCFFKQKYKWIHHLELSWCAMPCMHHKGGFGMTFLSVCLPTSKHPVKSIECTLWDKMLEILWSVTAKRYFQLSISVCQW